MAVVFKDEMVVCMKPHPNLIFRNIASVYDAIMTCRNFLYDKKIFKSYVSKIPIICVGNLTVGGSGKSPMCNYLARGFCEQNRKPVILSRGYRGSLKGPHVVSWQDSVASVGDEALMHLKSCSPFCPIVVARDRVSGVKYIESQNLGNVIILDDGYQHRRLARSINLVLVDVSDPSRIAAWEDDELLPAGFFREDRFQGLSRASAIVFVNKVRNISERELQRYSHFVANDVPTLVANFNPVCLRDIFSGCEFELGFLKTKAYRAIASIAAPESFITMLDNLGCELISQEFFPDHYVYDDSDWRRIATGESPLITTSKDAVKIRQFLSRKEQAFELVISVSLRGEDENKFWEIINKEVR